MCGPPVLCTRRLVQLTWCLFIVEIPKTTLELYKVFPLRMQMHFWKMIYVGRSEYLIHYSALEMPKVDLSLASVSVGCSCSLDQLHSVGSRMKTPNHFKWMHCFLLSSRWVGRFIVGHCGRVWGSGSWLWPMASVDSTLCFLLTNRCDCRVLLYVLAGVPLVNSKRSAAATHLCTWLLSAGKSGFGCFAVCGHLVIFMSSMSFAFFLDWVHQKWPQSILSGSLS